jgi:hypothetical protein
MPSDTRPTPQTTQSPNVADTMADPEILAQLNARRDNVGVIISCNLIF